MSSDNFWTQQAEQASRDAHAAAREAKARRDRLQSGTSDDPEADRYLLRQHEEDQRLAEANARDFKANAESTRKGWFR